MNTDDSGIKKITNLEAEKIIAIIDKDADSDLGVIKLGRFYYDITGISADEVYDFMNESNRRAINKIGVTRL